jgi:hypothetical protein
MFARVHSTACAVPHFDAFGVGLHLLRRFSLLMESVMPASPGHSRWLADQSGGRLYAEPRLLHVQRRPPMNYFP